MTRAQQLGLAGDLAPPRPRVDKIPFPAVKHSSASQEWYTPDAILDLVREVLGQIDLDPASCLEANERVQATAIITEEQDGLATPWPAGSVYCNPPGGRRQPGQSQSLLFWARLMDHRAAGALTHGIFYAFNGELIQVSQGRPHPSIADFPLCAPRRRVRLHRPGGGPGTRPPHHALIVYVPGTLDRTDTFARIFGQVGAVLVPRYSLERGGRPISLTVEQLRQATELRAQGLTHRAIADRLGTSESTVRRALRRGR